jgi:hypothetical protein
MVMVMAVVIMLIVTLLVTAVFSINLETLPLARGAQDYQTAYQAAEAGVQDYINRLDTNTTYYLNSTDSTNAALENGSTWTTWAPVAGGGTNEWYRYSVNNQNAARSGVVYLKVSGAAGQNPTSSNHYTVRSIQVALQMAGFTNYLYYTNYEIEDPSLVACFDESTTNCSRGSANGTDTYANACVWHAWELNQYEKTTYGKTEFGPDPVCGTTTSNGGCSYSSSSPAFSDCHIYFASSDTLNGPVFSNDEFNICGTAQFPKEVDSAYNQGTSLSSAGATSYGNAGAYHESSTSCGTPVFGAAGTQPAGHAYEQFPATNGNLQSDIPITNDGGGCLYYGPVTVQFVSDGKMIAYLTPGFTGSSASVPTGAVYSCVSAKVNNVYQEIPIPPNGLMYDANETACAPSCNSNSYADVSVSGTVGSPTTDEQVTVGSQYNINVTGNLTDYSTTGSDIIGLSAQHYILLPADGTALTIDAAMVANKDSIYLPNWGGVSAQGTYTLLGSMAEQFRGPVGTFSINNGTVQIVSGYAKAWTYDTASSTSSRPTSPPPRCPIGSSSPWPSVCRRPPRPPQSSVVRPPPADPPSSRFSGEWSNVAW